MKPRTTVGNFNVFLKYEKKEKEKIVQFLPLLYQIMKFNIVEAVFYNNI